MFSLSEDKTKLNETIPEEFQLGDWFEIDNILHISSGEFESSNDFVVCNHETQEEIAEIEMTNDMINGELIDPVFEAYEKDQDLRDHKQAIIYGQLFEKGSFSFKTIETDKLFDESKLKVSLIKWDGLKLIDAIEYDGETYNVDGVDTLIKWDGLKLIDAIEYDGETYNVDGVDTMNKSESCWID